jgi:hypothetical protein
MVTLILEPVDPGTVNVYVDDRLVAARVQLEVGELTEIIVDGAWD